MASSSSRSFICIYPFKLSLSSYDCWAPPWKVIHPAVSRFRFPEHQPHRLRFGGRRLIHIPLHGRSQPVLQALGVLAAVFCPGIAGAPASVPLVDSPDNLQALAAWVLL